MDAHLKQRTFKDFIKNFILYIYVGKPFREDIFPAVLVSFLDAFYPDKSRERVQFILEFQITVHHFKGFKSEKNLRQLAISTIKSRD